MRLFLPMVVSMLVYSLPGQAHDRVEFAGSWNEIVDDGHTDCQVVFAQSSYLSKHFLVGPGDRTIVTNFSNSEGGFFAGMSFVSNFGYNNDFFYDKTTTVDGVRYRIEIYGIINKQLVLMDADVTALAADDSEVCRSFGKFTGFD